MEILRDIRVSSDETRGANGVSQMGNSTRAFITIRDSTTFNEDLIFNGNTNVIRSSSIASCYLLDRLPCLRIPVSSISIFGATPSEARPNTKL